MNDTVLRLSVCLSHLLIAAAACGGFAAMGLAGKRYRSITATAGAAAAQRSAANAGSGGMFIADVGS